VSAIEQFVSYRFGGVSRRVAAISIALPSAVGLFFLFGALRAASPLAALTAALWFLAAIVTAWSSYRAAYEVNLSDDRLTWLAPFRTREVPLTEVQELRRTRFPSRLAVLELAGGKRLAVPKRVDFVHFVADLRQAAPRVQIRF
jgi:hypothetical protein